MPRRVSEFTIHEDGCSEPEFEETWYNSGIFIFRTSGTESLTGAEKYSAYLSALDSGQFELHWCNEGPIPKPPFPKLSVHIDSQTSAEKRKHVAKARAKAKLLTLLKVYEERERTSNPAASVPGLEMGVAWWNSEGFAVSCESKSLQQTGLLTVAEAVSRAAQVISIGVAISVAGVILTETVPEAITAADAIGNRAFAERIAGKLATPLSDAIKASLTKAVGGAVMESLVDAAIIFASNEADNNTVTALVDGIVDIFTDTERLEISECVVEMITRSIFDLLKQVFRINGVGASENNCHNVVHRVANEITETIDELVGGGVTQKIKGMAAQAINNTYTSKVLRNIQH